MSNTGVSDGSTKKKFTMYAFYHTVMRANEKQNETKMQNGNKTKKRLMTSEGPVSRGKVKCHIRLWG